MTAWIIFGAVLLLLFLLSRLRIGVQMEFGAAVHVRLRVGPIRLTVYPSRKEQGQAPRADSAEGPEKKAVEKGKKRTLPKLTREEGKELLATLLHALSRTLRRTRRHLRIDPLQMHVVFGGSDPADIAQTYGYACAAMWTLMPQAEQLFRIPDPSLRLDMDFDAPRTKAEGAFGASLRVGEGVRIALTLALPLLKWYLRRRKGEKTAAAPAAEAAQ